MTSSSPDSPDWPGWPGWPGWRDALERWIDAHHDELIAFRRHLHAHPERSGEEVATTEMVVGRLTAAGLAPRVLASGTGALCEIPLGEPGAPGAPIVALRADIDALAMHDEKDVPYRSRVDGLAHACGHDVHTTVVLGAGLALAELAERAELTESPGPAAGGARVRLIFQPAEERVPGGALSVIDDGGLDGVAAIFGVHCDPKLDVGLLGVTAGPITSAADMLTVHLHGPGGHTARPERTVDLTALAAQVTTELPERSAEGVAHIGPLRVVFGSVHAGGAGNVIPSRATLKGTVRTTDRAVWSAAPGAVAAALDAIAAPHAERGATAELEYTVGIPPVVNDERATAVLRAAASDVLGPTAVVPTEQSAGGDDFAWYVERIPGSYARLGTHDPGSPDPRLDLHASHFDVDERAIAVGIRVLVATALRVATAGVPPVD